MQTNQKVIEAYKSSNWWKTFVAEYQRQHPALTLEAVIELATSYQISHLVTDSITFARAESAGVLTFDIWSSINEENYSLYDYVCDND